MCSSMCLLLDDLLDHSSLIDSLIDREANTFGREALSAAIAGRTSVCNTSTSMIEARNRGLEQDSNLAQSVQQ